MDADNRVILNCGGIRHESYKTTLKKEFASLKLSHFIIEKSILYTACDSVKSKTFLLIVMSKFYCESQPDSSHSALEIDGSTCKLRSSPQ